MDVPQELTDQVFRQKFQRFVVIRFLMSNELLDDPARSERYKYAVILNLDPTDAGALFVITTSKIEKFQDVAKRIRDALHCIPVRSYTWVTSDTVVDLRDVKSYPTGDLKKLFQIGKLTFHEKLNENDINIIEDKLRSSTFITAKILKQIID